MAAGPEDDLELLLGDVRRTISENERFLRALAEDAGDGGLAEEDAEERDEEEFEEL